MTEQEIFAKCLALGTANAMTDLLAIRKMVRTEAEMLMKPSLPIRLIAVII